MGVYDRVVDTEGKYWQTKDGWPDLTDYHPGDTFPSETMIRWIRCGRCEPPYGEEGCEETHGLVLDGVWTGRMGHPDAVTQTDVVALAVDLQALLKARNEELRTQVAKLQMRVGELEAKDDFEAD